jgi:flagellin-like protein
MMKMKGITPIISVIILLLITIGMAASAWTFMSGYFTTITKASIQATGLCVGTGGAGPTNALVTITNMGQGVIQLGACTGVGSIGGGTAKSVICGDMTIVRTDGVANLNGKFDKTSMSAKGTVTFTDTGCTTGTECHYSFILPGMMSPQSVIIQC